MLRVRRETVVTAVAGVIIGFFQCEVALAGMRATAKVDGLAGIGVAEEYALAWLGVSLLLLLVVCAALRLRCWALAAVALLAGELLVMGIVWSYTPLLGLHGHAQAVMFIPTAILVLAAGSLGWGRA